MLTKLRDFTIVAFVSIKGFVQSIKEDERGLSGVVVAVLLVLVAIFAVLLVWTELGGWLGELWKKITESANELKR